MFFKKEKEKKMNVPDLWNFMTSLNKKDKALFEELLDNDNEPLEYKGDVKQGGLLKNKAPLLQMGGNHSLIYYV